MIRSLMTLAGLVGFSCLGNPFAQAFPEGIDITVTTSRRVHPILIRNEHNALLQIVVNVEGDKEVRLQAMHFALDGSDAVGDLDSLALFATGDKPAFSPASPCGKPSGAARTVVFREDRALRRGANVFWLSCRLKPAADLSHRVAAVCTSVETTAGKVTAGPVAGNSSAHRHRPAQAQGRWRAYVSDPRTGNDAQGDPTVCV